QNTGRSVINRRQQIVGNTQRSGLSGETRTVGRLEGRETGGFHNVWAHAVLNKAFNDFSNGGEIRNWSVIGSICGIEVRFFKKWSDLRVFESRRKNGLGERLVSKSRN